MLKIDPFTHQLNIANICLSPNFDDRPGKQEIDLLVIHNISLPPGEFESDDVLAFFTNELEINKHPYFAEIADVKVSCHLFIRRTGEVWQLVPFDKRAWHAGQSIFQERAQCNDFSIGIELEGTDDLAYTSEQYTQLANIAVMLMHQYPKITADRIVGHSDIAPHRKTDPGPAFDWDHFHELVNSVTL